MNEDVVSMTASTHGKKYIIDGILKTPKGRDVKIRTVWIVEHNDARPRFITAYSQ